MCYCFLLSILSLHSRHWFSQFHSKTAAPLVSKAFLYSFTPDIRHWPTSLWVRKSRKWHILGWKSSLKWYSRDIPFWWQTANEEYCSTRATAYCGKPVRTNDFAWHTCYTLKSVRKWTTDYSAKWLLCAHRKSQLCVCDFPKSVLWTPFPFQTHWATGLIENSASLLIRKPRLVIGPNTQHTQRDGWRREKETQRGPLSVAAGSDSRGRPDPFTFVSLNGFNSRWGGERGGLQNQWERWAEEF